MASHVALHGSVVAPFSFLGHTGMKLTKYFTRVTASLEAQDHAEILHEVQHGELSDVALAIESQRDGAAELAVATVESLHAARRLDNDASELCELESYVQEMRAGIAAVNANGGFSLESMNWANVAIQAVLGQAVPNPPQLAASVESFAEGRQVLSTEGLDSVIQTIGEVRADVEAKSVDGILRVFDVLKDAMPEVKDRLQALKQALPATAYDEEKEIRLDDLVFKSLAVDGALPGNLGDYMVTYADFAKRILSGYSENALESASKSKLVAEAIAKLGDNCPIAALAKVYAEIGDPRNGIPVDQLCFALPGSGPLFGNKVDVLADGGEGVGDGAVDDPEAVPEAPVDDVAATEDMGADVGADDLTQRLQQFCTSRAPLDPLSYADRDSAEGENPTVRVVSKDTIAKTLTALITAFEIVDIKSFAEARRQTWTEARSAYGAFQQQLINIQPSQIAVVRPVAPALAEYLDTVFALSAWPALHLLTNLVFTANGFLLLAERSIAGKTEDAPVDDTPVVDDEAEAPASEVPDAAAAVDPVAADTVPAEDADVTAPADDAEVDTAAAEPTEATVDAPEGVDVSVNVTDDAGETPPGEEVEEEAEEVAEAPAGDETEAAEAPAEPEVEEPTPDDDLDAEAPVVEEEEEEDEEGNL